MSRTVFLTVHGTFDGIANPAAPRWWEPTSPFWQAILAHSPHGGLDGTVQSFVWSGKNSAYEREVAARALAKQLKTLRARYDNIHLIGHSHGGNVIEDALERIAWNGARRPSFASHKNPSKIRSVTTLGTPFLDRRESTLRKVLIILTLLLVIGIVLLAVLFAILATALSGISLDASTVAQNREKLYEAYAVAALIPIVFLLPLVLLFIRNWHTLRFRRSSRTPANWLSVFHPQDEAIFLLTTTNANSYEFYQPGVISANVRHKLDAAIIFGGAGALIFFGLSLLAAYLGLVKVPVFGTTIDIGGVLVALGLLALMLSPVFAVVRLLVGFFDKPLRNWANSQVRKILRGLAFGEDHHVKLVDVAAVPFVFECSGVAVTGPIGEQMADEAKDSFVGYVSASHQCISWQSAQANSAAIGDMLMGLTTVRTIHSSYFHRPEIAAMIADHLHWSQPPPEPRADAG
jgi:hypothetical protein